jgi:hypothetical protein
MRENRRRAALRERSPAPSGPAPPSRLSRGSFGGSRPSPREELPRRTGYPPPPPPLLPPPPPSLRPALPESPAPFRPSTLAPRSRRDPYREPRTAVGAPPPSPLPLKATDPAAETAATRTAPAIPVPARLPEPPPLPLDALQGQSCPWTPMRAPLLLPPPVARPGAPERATTGRAEAWEMDPARARWSGEPPSPLPEQARCPRCRSLLPWDGEEHLCAAEAELEELLRSVTRDRPVPDLEAGASVSVPGAPDPLDGSQLWARARRWL